LQAWFCIKYECKTTGLENVLITYKKNYLHALRSS
jgi:hypothetical protein